jgi:hypothetical protein
MIDFELIVPAGWVHIPTTEETSRLRMRIIDEIVTQYVPPTLPRDRAEPWRQHLRKELRAVTADAAQNGARAVLLPLSEFEGTRLPGSLLLAVIEDRSNPDVDRVLGEILDEAGDRGISLEVGRGPAVRVETVIESGPVRRDHPSIRVSYYVAHPEHSGVWGLVTFTVLTDGDVDDLAVRAAVLAFDGVAGSLYWTERDQVPTEQQVLDLMGPKL